MLMQYNLKMTHEIYSGENAMKNLKDILIKNQVKKAAVFTDKGIQGAGLLDYPMEQIQAAGVETIILNELLLCVDCRHNLGGYLLGPFQHQGRQTGGAGRTGQGTRQQLT